MRIVPISEDLLAESVRVLVGAFYDEPITAMLLDLSRPEIDRLHVGVAETRLALHLEAGAPLLAVVEESSVIGLAMLKSPHTKIPRWRSMRRWAPLIPGMVRLLPLLGRGIRVSRLLKPPHDLPEPHYTVEALAVRSSHRGRGVARLLLEEIETICAADPSCSGVYLCAGSDENRLLYEHFGYEVRETRHKWGDTTYHMFLDRPRATVGT